MVFQCNYYSSTKSEIVLSMTLNCLCPFVSNYHVQDSNDYVPYLIFTMNRIADLYQKSDTDACIFTRRGDMAELLMVNPSSGASKHIYMYAPLKLLEQKLVPLVNKGYKICDYINLCLADKVINGIEVN